MVHLDSAEGGVGALHMAENDERLASLTPKVVGEHIQNTLHVLTEQPTEWSN
jgi:hypothetical protein